MKRENNIDLLKIVACIMVISIHVSAYYVEYLNIGNLNFLIGNFCDSFSRPAVPLFVLITGRYALSEEKNTNYIKYYQKIFKKIYIPTIIYSFLYICYTHSSQVLKYLFHNIPLKIDIVSSIKSWLIGNPYYHLWYLYMVLGLYILVPFLIKLKNKIGEKNFLKLGILFFILGFIIFQLKTYLDTINFYDRDDYLKYLKYFWYFNQFKFIQFLGYFILGYSLKNVKINSKLCFFIIIFSLFSIFISVQYTKNYEYYYSYNSLFVMSAAIFLYLFFSNITINKDLSKIVDRTFGIYLIHAGVLSLVQIIINKVFFYFRNLAIIDIPFLILIVFFLSFILDYFINKIVIKFNKKFLY